MKTRRQYHLYLARQPLAVLNLYKCCVVGWSCSKQPDAALTCDALRNAWESRQRPEQVLFHPDQGCQYTNRQFRIQLIEYNMIQSMSRRGNCWDNASMERVFRTYKTEWMPYYDYATFEEAQQDITAFVHYCNFERGHSHNRYAPPTVAEAAYYHG